jgi:hypothetical protein
MYIFGLGPGLLRDVLPHKYWKNFCKLVYGIRIIHQYKIPAISLRCAHEALLDFVQEFEMLYYQRLGSRLHFIRPCLHLLIHLAPEVLRVGPGLCSSQWTMERVIGDLGQEIRQPSNPYANLSQRALRRCQVNALKAMLPDLAGPPNHLPRGAVPIGNNYTLLRAKEKYPKPVRDCEARAFAAYMQEQGANILDVDSWRPSVSRWARLRLPNGQVARSAWKEGKSLRRVRIARNVKVSSILVLHLCMTNNMYLFSLSLISTGSCNLPKSSSTSKCFLMGMRRLLRLCPSIPLPTRLFLKTHITLFGHAATGATRLSKLLMLRQLLL